MDLEKRFGVSLGAYVYSPFSLMGIAAWRQVHVFGFDVTYSEQPKVQFAFTLNGERFYQKIDLGIFKKTFRPVVIEDKLAA